MQLCCMRIHICLTNMHSKLQKIIQSRLEIMIILSFLTFALLALTPSDNGDKNLVQAPRCIANWSCDYDFHFMTVPAVAEALSTTGAASAFGPSAIPINTTTIVRTSAVREEYLK